MPCQAFQYTPNVGPMLQLAIGGRATNQLLPYHHPLLSRRQNK